MFLVGILAFIFRGLVVGDSGAPKRVELPKVPKALRDKVEKAEEEALIARVEARVEATKEVEKLEEVSKIKDGAERRKRLAGLLKDL